MKEFGEWMNSCNINFIVGGIRYESEEWLCIGFFDGMAYESDDEYEKVSALVCDLVGGDLEALDAMDELMLLDEEPFVRVAKAATPSEAVAMVESYFKRKFDRL
tara:strand:+ start:107 stop:418 length:312 start_codon:yes stop_codon:yes gene_type:complete